LSRDEVATRQYFQEHDAEVSQRSERD
jgi:hypothetical protein